MSKILFPQNVLKMPSLDNEDKQASIPFFFETPWHNGDCEIAGPNVSGALTGPKLELFSNGTGVFTANCRSTDTNDTLEIAFSFDDVNGNQVYHAPHIPGLQPDADAGHFSFNIQDSNTWKLCVINFAFDACLYGRIKTVRTWCQC